MIVKTDDLKENVVTYMEALRITRDKLNEVIDVVNTLSGDIPIPTTEKLYKYL